MVGEPGPLQFRLERRVDAPRAVVWQAMARMIDRSAPDAQPPPSQVGGEVRFSLDEWKLRERTVASQPPSLRIYRVIEGAPALTYEGRSELLDVGDGCLLTWTVHAEPAPGRDDEFRAFIARAEIAVTRGVDAVVTAIPSLDGPASHRFAFERAVSAAPQRVWDAIATIYANAEYAELTPNDPPYGRDAVIRYWYGPWQQRAVVAAWDPPHRRVYELLDGAPVRRYRGTTTVQPAVGGSVLHWACEFALDPDIPADEYLRLAEETVGRAVEHVVEGSVAPAR